MLWSDLLAEIQRGLKEPSSDGHWTPAELLRRANVAQRDFSALTQCINGTDSSTTSVSGTSSYTKPAGASRILAVRYAGVKLFGIPKEELDMAEAEGTTGQPWVDDTGTPTNYYQTPTSVVLYPKPNNTGDAISFDYIKRPDDMTTDSSVPFDSIDWLYDFHHVIVEYVLWKCKLEDGIETWVEHKKDYLRMVNEAKTRVNGPEDELATFSLLRRRDYKNNRPLPLW